MKACGIRHLSPRRLLSVTVILSLVLLHLVLIFLDLRALSDKAIHFPTANHKEQPASEVPKYYSRAEASVVDLIREYQSKHNVDVLRLETDGAQGSWSQQNKKDLRRFVVGRYSCPQQAGNRLHEFLNNFAFAIITNRTFLYQYCEDDHQCPLHGTVSDCERVLHRFSWIPQYKPHWYNSRPTKIAPKWFFVNEIANNRIRIPLDELQQQFVTVGAVNSQHKGIISNLGAPKAKAVLSPAAHTVAKQFLSAGIPFTYGALLNAAFQIAPTVHPQLSAIQKDAIDKGISLAIHSRHFTSEYDNGSDVSADENCLRQAFREIIADSGTKTRANQTCSVSIMADRNASLHQLSLVARDLGCEPIVADHEYGKSFRSEHGEFAGTGLFQDLAVAQLAKNAVIVTGTSTASELMAALVAFRRRELPDLPPLVTCSLNRYRGICHCSS